MNKKKTIDMDCCYILPHDYIIIELISSAARCTNLNLKHYAFRLNKYMSVMRNKVNQRYTLNSYTM